MIHQITAESVASNKTVNQNDIISKHPPPPAFISRTVSIKTDDIFPLRHVIVQKMTLRKCPLPLEEYMWIFVQL